MLKKKDFDISKIKAIATDLDGTALAGDHKFAPETALVLDTLADKGYKVILATGRPYLDAVGLTSMCKHRFPLVTSNGAMLNFASPNKDITHFVPADVVEDLINREYPKGIILNVYTQEEWFVNEPNEEVAKYFADSHFEYNLLDKNKINTQEIVKVFIIDSFTLPLPTEYSVYLNNLEKEIDSLHQGKIESCFSQINCLEINAYGVTKAKTISEYLENFNLTNSEHLLAFGDGMNDAAMLSSASHSFIMGNADPKLKRQLEGSPNTTVVGDNRDLMVARICNDLFELGLDLPPYFEE